jgi:putative phosphoesterase
LSLPTRVCILADTHGTLDPRVLAEAARCDLVVHGGDIGDAAVLDALRDACGEVIAVLGNNDVAAKWPALHHDTLHALPEQAHIALPGGVLAVEHGHRVNPVAARHGKLRARHPHSRAIVYGHSHQLLLDQDTSPWVLNPGAAGRARTNGGPSCLLLQAGIRQWRLTPLRFLPQ